MSLKKWSIAYAPFRDVPNGMKLLDVPLGAVVEPAGEEQETEVGGQRVKWEKVLYRGKSGWVNTSYLDELIEKFPNFEVPIPNATPDETDAAQYMILEGDVKNNMCGELCVAFIGREDIVSFVNKWKVVSPNYYNWAISGNRDNPTGPDALESMLKVYGYDPDQGDVMSFKEGLTDPVIGFKISPGRMKKKLETHYLIAGVKIDSVSGKLRGQGTGHWVVLDKLEPNGINGGWVEIYNPFPNKRQQYSYDEFINSCGGPSWTGVWVKRTLD